MVFGFNSELPAAHALIPDSPALTDVAILITLLDDVFWEVGGLYVMGQA